MSMNNDIMMKCLRLEVGEDEFTDKKFLNESMNLEFVKPEGLSSKVESSDDEFDDTMYALDDANEDDTEDIAIIDTELTDTTEGDAKPTDYVGKYICVCPICLSPIFSDVDAGEIYCPVCDKEVEIEAAQGKVVSPDAEVNDEVSEEGPIDDIASDAVSDLTDEGNAESGDAGLDNDGNEKSEALDPDDNPKIFIDDLVIEDAVGDDRINSLEEFIRVMHENDFNVSKKEAEELYKYYVDEFDKYIKSNPKTDELESKEGKTESIDGSLNESVNISVCPEGSVTVTSDDAEATVTVAPTNSDAIDPAIVSDIPAVGTEVVDDVVKSDAIDPEEVVDIEVDDFDTESFDGQVNSMINELYDDESIKYESVAVKRNDKGLVVEGIIKSESTKRSKLVKFLCNCTKSKSSQFKVEGLQGLTGKVFVEGKYNSTDKSLKVESMRYKFLTKSGDKVKILKNN